MDPSVRISGVCVSQSWCLSHHSEATTEISSVFLPHLSCTILFSRRSNRTGLWKLKGLWVWWIGLILPPAPLALATHISATPSVFNSIPMLFSSRMHVVTLHPHTSHSTSLWLFPRQLPNFSGLLSAHYFLWARHPLQVAFSPPDISNTFCPLQSLHFQHVFSQLLPLTSSPLPVLSLPLSNETLNWPSDLSITLWLFWKTRQAGWMSSSPSPK